MSEVGDAAVDLLTRWRAHERGDCAASNTLFAVFGIASMPGRFADKYRNVIYTIWLGDIAYDHGVDNLGEAPPCSKSAAVIINNGLVRYHGRRVPMTASARDALLGYYREKLKLLSEIDPMVRDYACTKLGRHERARNVKRTRFRIARHGNATMRVLRAVEELRLSEYGRQLLA
jgi:hypothetical protein